MPFTVLLMSPILITIICLRATRRPSIQLSRGQINHAPSYTISNIHSPPFISCSIASLISESLFLIFYSHHVLSSVSLYLFSLIRVLSNPLSGYYFRLTSLRSYISLYLFSFRSSTSDPFLSWAWSSFDPLQGILFVCDQSFHSLV